jgi:hypothetical protein
MEDEDFFEETDGAAVDLGPQETDAERRARERAQFRAKRDSAVAQFTSRYAMLQAMAGDRDGADIGPAPLVLNG